MDLLPLCPAHLHQGADFNGRLTDSDFTAQDGRLRESGMSDHAQAALAHIVNSSRNCGPSASLAAELW